MTICDDLRQSVLQAAIQGKLTQQLPEDGTASDLLEAIKAEKDALVKAKKIKKSKALHEISEDAAPFDIPQNWMWTSLSTIGSFSSGKTPDMTNSEYWNNSTVNWMTSKDMKKKYLTESSMKISADASKTMVLYPAGTLLMVVRSGILKRALPVCVLTQASTINQDVKAYELFNIDMVSYIFYMLKGLEPNILQNYTKRITTVDSLKFDEFSTEMPIPLPPLAEQKRIVAKVDELMAKIDDLEKTEKELEAMKKAFPGDMKAALLQAAMQGKLTEQLESDGDAEVLLESIKAEKAALVKAKKIKKEKPLEPIADEEMPFDIPGNWRWVQLRAIINVYGGLSYNKNNLSETSNEMITVFRGGNIQEQSYSFKPDDIKISKTFIKNNELFLKKNQLLTPSVTSLERLGKVARIDRDYDDVVAGGFVLNLVPYMDNDVLSRFIECAFSMPLMKKRCQDIANKSGQAFYNLSREKLLDSWIPVPPLAEQERIVEKLDKLLPLCDGLVEK